MQVILVKMLPILQDIVNTELIVCFKKVLDVDSNLPFDLIEIASKLTVYLSACAAMIEV